MQKNNKNYNQEIEMGNLFKIILVILVVFGFFYILTYYMQKNKKTTMIDDESNKFTTIQYDEILIGDSLNQREEEYYVLFAKQSDYNSRYKEYISRYNNKHKFYYSLIDNGLNRRFISNESNLNVENIDDLRIKDISLIKIKDGRIIEAYDGNANVMQAFININK